ncbi:hypothetical protein ACNR9Q_04690 [Maribacter sp. X9]|uniref:hypothetical protein n=1 Tax=Maribacter sp. X9 TaxID=3402159 RepID=UPI003AF38879
MKRKVTGIVLLLILLTPVFMWMGWVLTPKKKLVIALVDKTVLTAQGQEHISLNWILNHNRYTKTQDKSYKIERDYFGFFPLEDEKYLLKGLERFSSEKLNLLSADADLAYVTDTYGIYTNEWFKKGDINNRSSMLYGGLSYEDLVFLKAMKERHKLILTEFNTIGSPTMVENRKTFEHMFGLHWTGWTARYFDNLDSTTNLDLPQWLVDNYKKANNGAWPFTKPGVAFVNEKEQVVILEEGTHLKNALPYINTTPQAQQKWHLPDTIKYPFWFDVIIPDLKINQVNATFKLNLLPKGEEELAKYSIPQNIPAITSHLEDDYKFFYFSGDFSDNPVGTKTSYFKGIHFFKSLFYDERNPLERNSFFWNFYRPLISQILEDELHALEEN